MDDDMISRQAALDALGKRPVVWTDKIYYILGARNQYDSNRLAIETVPTVDAVPVAAYEQVRWERDIAVGQLEKLGYTLGEKVTPIVRCKDCKYSHMTVNGECKYCDMWFPDEAEYVDGDYYCASGERKDGDEK